MGQEIFYCCRCQAQIRSADFTKGGALKLGDRACCVKCGPALLATLTPKEQELFFREAAKLKASSSGPGTSRHVLPPPPAPVARPVPAAPENRAPLMIGIVAVLLVVVLLMVWNSGRAAPREASIEAPKPPVAAAPVAPAPALPVPPPPDLRKIPEPRRGVEPAVVVEPAPVPPVVPEPKVEPPTPVPVEAPKPAVPPLPPSADPAVPPVAAPKRAPLPEAAKLKDAEAALRKTFNLDQARTAKDKADLARTLLQTAASSGAKEADLIVLLRQARTLAAQGGDLKTSLEAIDAMAAAFDVDARGEKADLFAKSTLKGSEASIWASAALEQAQEASDGDDYDRAVKLAGSAETLARAASDRGLQETAKDRVRELTEIKRLAEGLKAPLKTLESKPDDPAANVAVGKFLCLVKGEWKRGLPMLVKGSEPSLKSLGEQETAAPTDAPAQAALGEAWAAQADRETPTYKVRARGRAGEWLTRAIPGLTGLAKVSSERKLASLGPLVASKDRQVLDLGDRVKIEIVYLRAAVFTMGSSTAPVVDWRVDERPEHKVTLSKGFHLGKHEVTRGQFAAFVKATGYKTDAERLGNAYGRPLNGDWTEIQGLNWQNTMFPQTDDHPVVCVSWADARAFCDWASKKTGRGVRLPTEAEWEYACRAGTRTKWSFGDDESAFAEHAWHDKNSGLQTHPVGQRKANPWGFHDMHGNVLEWVQDWAAVYTGENAVDPTGPASGDRRILRGGGWNYEPAHSFSGSRSRENPASRYTITGFRVAVN